MEVKLKTTIPYLYVEGYQFNKKYLVVKEDIAEKLLLYKEIITKEEEIEEIKDEEIIKVDLTTLTVAEFKELAKEHNVENYSKLKKQELIDTLDEVI